MKKQHKIIGAALGGVVLAGLIIFAVVMGLNSGKEADSTSEPTETASANTRNGDKNDSTDNTGTDIESIEEDEEDIGIELNLTKTVMPRITQTELDSLDVIVYVTDVTEFGADKTGQVDSTQAFKDAILMTKFEGGGQVFVPAGIYKLEGNLDLPQGVTLRGEWQNPHEGGLGKGTILAAYANRGKTEGYPLIYAHSTATIRDLSIWYPEQDINNVTPYPYTIDGADDGDTINVMNVTLYNSYQGVRTFNTHGCTTVRNLYGTVLGVGIFEDKGFDIGRYESIYFDSMYWAESGLPNAPTADEINAYTYENTIGFNMYQDDWGYLYDLNFKNMKIGIQFDHANCAIADITTENVNIGIKINKISYPGLMVANSNITANIGENPVCIQYDNFVSNGVEQLAVANTTFASTGTGIYMNGSNNPFLSLQNCTFTEWGDYAVNVDRGTVIIMDSEFKEAKKSIRLSDEVFAANVLSNRFNGEPDIVNEMGGNYNINQKTIDVPRMPEYDYTYAPTFVPPNPTGFINVKDAPYNAAGDEKTDDTAAIQAALDAMSEAGGGTVFVPGGRYVLEGSLTVPTGVELRGSFDYSHVGKVLTGTVFFVRGGMGNPDAEATINVSANASVRGFSMYYPEQGYDEKSVIQYPWAVRGLGENCSIKSVCLINAYNGFDLMTYRCDGAILADTNSFAIMTQAQMGKGMVGGWLQDVHFNISNWQQSSWPNAPNNGGKGDKMQQYCADYAVGFKFGACTDLYNFQNFTILINTAILMVEEPEGSYSGTFNGFAFDANVVGLDIEQAGTLNFINPMDVTILNGGGPNIRTRSSFTGTLNYFNGDSWGGGTQLCDIYGGTVNIVQYNSWCSPNANVKGGTLNLYAPLFMHQGQTGSDIIIGENAESAKLIGAIAYQKGSYINRAGSNFIAEFNLNTDGSEFNRTAPLVGVRDGALKNRDTGEYVTVSDTGAMAVVGATAVTEAEMFLLEPKGASHNLVAYTTGKYICAEGGGSSALVADRGSGGVWEELAFYELPDGNIGVVAVVNNKYLVAGPDGRIYASGDETSENLLIVEPMLSETTINETELNILNKLGLGVSDIIAGSNTVMTNEQALAAVITMTGGKAEALGHTEDIGIQNVSGALKPYVAFALSKGIINQSFNPSEEARGTTAAAYFIELLGYGKPAYYNIPNLATNLLYKRAVDTHDLDRKFTAGDLAVMGCNALLAKPFERNRELIVLLVEDGTVTVEQVDATNVNELMKKAGTLSTQIPDLNLGDRLDRSVWIVTDYADNPSVSRMIDSDMGSRWDTGAPQKGDEWILIDLSIRQPFSKIILDSSQSSSDYPRMYEVYLSDDGEAWGTAVSSGASGESVTEIEFETEQTARYIKICQTGTATDNYWSVHELYVIR